MGSTALPIHRRNYKNQGHKPISINGTSDHVHILLGMRPTQSLSDLIREIKGDSSQWINRNNLVTHKFSWQKGYGAFSYSKSQISAVARYIENQKIHHKKKTFIEEYSRILSDLNIEFDEKFIFKSISD